MTPAAPRIRRATPRTIEEAARLLLDGRLVAFPTETVYGLGADATNDAALAAVFAVKNRPRFNPLIVHFPDAAAAAERVVFDARARTLARAFWPGALTLVLPRRAESGISLLASAGLDTLAVRVPDHEIARALLDAAACPVAAPSANPSGRVSPTTAAHVADTLAGGVDLILDGGSSAVGLESTVVDLGGGPARLLRPGGLAAEAIEAEIGPLAPPDMGAGVRRSPGMLERHYAPALALRLNATRARPGEALLGFGPEAPRDALNLSPAGDLAEAAANFFAMVRTLDTSGAAAIAVMPIPEEGLGRAINDRLRRAAATGGERSPDSMPRP